MGNCNAKISLKGGGLRGNCAWGIMLLTLTITFTSIFPSFFSVMAHAQSDPIVVDEAGLFGNRMGEVQMAAQKLMSLGADIRVRTIKTYGASGNLDRYESELEQQNPSWTTLDSTRKNNLIVIIISLEERQTGIYYGSQWESTLSAHWLRIQTDIMNLRFQRGDFAGGFIVGMEEIQRLIAQQRNGQAGSPAPANSALWIFFAVIVIVSGTVAGLFLLRSYQRSRERRLATRQRALLAKQVAASGINELIERMQMLEVKVNATAAKVSSGDVASLFDSLDKVKKLIDQGAEIYGELSHSAGDPESHKLGEAQFEVIEQEYQKVNGILRQAKDIINHVESQVVTFQQAINSFPDKITEVNAAIDKAIRSIETVQKSGFKTDYPEDLLAKAYQTMEQGVALSQNKQFLPAMKFINEAINLASQTAQMADELPKKKQEVEAAIPALESRIEQVKETIQNGRGIFEEITRYAESSWESIRGNGTEAENRIDWTEEALDGARKAMSMERQEWHNALELVKKGEEWLDEAETLMKSISSLQVSLAEAKRDAPGEITSAQADITKAWDYINKYDEDIRESLEDDLREAEKKIDASRKELKKDKPDYLRAVKLAQGANASADKILDHARNEHETAERQRAKAASSLRDARAAVSRAMEYIEDHRRDAGSEASEHLIYAISALDDAKTDPNPATQISSARKAESESNMAYFFARDSVSRNCWERRQSTMIIFPTESSRGGGLWSSRHGSSSGWGGFFGGGGSSGWGLGGGRGGSGSTGW